MAESSFDKLMQVSMGFTLPRTLHVVAELGIADALGEAPRNAEALATATGTDVEALNRALRLLAAHGIFERQGSNYAHTPTSCLLRSDHPQSMRSFIRMQGIPALWRMWEHLDYSLRTGRSAAEKTLPNGGFWGYFADNPEHSRLFNDAMTDKAHGQAVGILGAYKFADFSTFADIGGGNGHLLQAILEATPNLQGVLFDLPHVIEQAAAIASDRLKLHAGNFFKNTLPVCDAYLMMQILHDWSDQEAAQILKTVRRSAPPHAKLLLVEWLIPEKSEPNWTLFVDLLMLAELNGKERTRTEFENLLRESDFTLERVIDVGFNTFILESSVI